MGHRDAGPPSRRDSGQRGGRVLAIFAPCIMDPPKCSRLGYRICGTVIVFHNYPYLGGLILVVLSPGCHHDQPVKSRLAGAWYIEQGIVRTIFEDGQEKEVALRYSDAKPDLVIREDGTFDLSISRHFNPRPLFRQLRRAGDYVGGDGISRFRFEVLESRFTRNSSYVVTRFVLPHWTDTTISQEAKIGLLGPPTYRSMWSYDGNYPHHVITATLKHFEGDFPRLNAEGVGDPETRVPSTQDTAARFPSPPAGQSDEMTAQDAGGRE